VHTRIRRELLPVADAKRAGCWAASGGWCGDGNGSPACPPRGRRPQISHTNDTRGSLSGTAGRIPAPRRCVPDRPRIQLPCRGHRFPPRPGPSPGHEPLPRRLREHRESLNRLNVYPVPDGGYRHNMTLTMESVVGALDGTSSLADVSQAMAHGSLMGAQGNSASSSPRSCGPGPRRSACTRRSARLSCSTPWSRPPRRLQGVGHPVEGTILTGAAPRRRRGQGGRRVGRRPGRPGGSDLRPCRAGAARDSRAAAVLKAAGVVDAGGAGLLLLFATLREHISGSKVCCRRPSSIPRPSWSPVTAGPAGGRLHRRPAIRSHVHARGPGGGRRRSSKRPGPASATRS